MARDSVGTTILSFVIGAGIGAAAALLLAPKSGKKLREDIAEGISDGLDEVQSAGKNLRRRANKLVDLAKDQVQDALDAGNGAFSQAKKT